MAREEVQQWDLEAWNGPLPDSSRGGPAVQEIRRTLALGVMLDPDIARFFTLLGDALFAVSSAANSNGQPLELSECTGSIATMLQLLGSLKAQCKVWSTTSSGALQKFTRQSAIFCSALPRCCSSMRMARQRSESMCTRWREPYRFSTPWALPMQWRNWQPS